MQFSWVFRFKILVWSESLQESYFSLYFVNIDRLVYDGDCHVVHGLVYKLNALLRKFRASSVC